MPPPPPFGRSPPPHFVRGGQANPSSRCTCIRALRQSFHKAASPKGKRSAERRIHPCPRGAVRCCRLIALRARCPHPTLPACGEGWEGARLPALRPRRSPKRPNAPAQPSRRVNQSVARPSPGLPRVLASVCLRHYPAIHCLRIERFDYLPSKGILGVMRAGTFLLLWTASARPHSRASTRGKRYSSP
jgi:hypothetical protein